MWLLLLLQLLVQWLLTMMMQGKRYTNPHACYRLVLLHTASAIGSGSSKLNPQPTQTHPYPFNPHNTQHAAVFIAKITSLTNAACKDRQSLIRQRCRCERITSHAESSSAPQSAARIENIHSAAAITWICTPRQQSTATDQPIFNPNASLPLQPSTLTTHNTPQYPSQKSNH